MGMLSFMRLFRPLILVLTASICLACASGPAPEKLPKDAHQSIRHLNKGTAYYIKGCYPQALRHIQAAHERFAAADDLQGVADSLNTMANIYFRMDDYQSALAVFDETIPIYEQLGDRVGQVRALVNKSAALIAARRLEDALQALDRADGLSQSANILGALRLKTRAMLLLAKDDAKEAENLLARALDTVPESDPALQADIQYTLAHLMLTTRRPQLAVTHVDHALKIDRAAGAYFSIGLDLAALGSCYQELAQYAEAVDFYKRSLKIFALLEAPKKVQWVLPRLASSAQKAGLNLQATLHWTEQWLDGQGEAGVCR